jgi:hypothetical protein
MTGAQIFFAIGAVVMVCLCIAQWVENERQR